MILDDVKRPGTAHRRKRRVGRGPGSGNGKTAGRGHKGQKSRSGSGGKRAHEGGQMPLFRRLPKRGFTNALFRVEYAIINVGQIQELSESGEFDLASLKSMGVIGKKASRLKILADGDISRAVKVTAHRFSESAKKKIEAAGGQVELVS